jgi:hypothetical protein
MEDRFVAVKKARKRLREEHLPWHAEYDRWKALEGSSELADMQRVVNAMGQLNA